MFTKLIVAALTVGTAFAIPATTDIYYHDQTMMLGPAMWTFASDGVKVHSVDGTQLIKEHTNVNLRCPDTDTGLPGCSYFDVITDGQKYVWASALHSSPNRVDIFSIETGEYVGGVKTDSTPMDLDYIPNREEVWVRSAASGGAGHVGVINANALSAATEEISLGDTRAYGYQAFHSTLGNFGYVTVNDANVLHKIDLASRAVVGNFTLDANAHSAYDMTYSKHNKHLYIRSRVCCSCGFEGADSSSCGRGPGSPTAVTIGPSAGQTLQGTCGGGCEGSPADLLGVLEFDTVSETFIAKHQIKAGTGFGATPEASPDGKHILMFGNDGGQNVRVLQANANGQPSTLAFDIPVNFEGVNPGAEAVTDFAVVQWKNHDIVVLASSADNNLVLVDLSMSPPKVSKLQMSAASETTGSGRGRMVEWAYDTPYIWVDGNGADELYIIHLSDDGDIDKAIVERTVTDTNSGMMVYVEDYAERKNLMMLTELIKSVATDGSGSGGTPAVSTSEDSVAEAVSADTIVAQVKNDLEKEGFVKSEDDDASPIAIAALAIGCLSLMLNIMFMLHFAFQKSTPEAAKPESADDNRTLGSKRVA